MVDSISFIMKYSQPDFAISEDTTRLLQDPSFRESLLKELHGIVNQSHAQLLREILTREMEYRRAEPTGDLYENLYWAAFLLYRIGDLNDVLLLWRAKNLDFDTFCGFDIQFLVGAGVNSTIQYLHPSFDPEAWKAEAYILGCKNSGDFEDLEGWFDWRMTYFNDMILE